MEIDINYLIKIIKSKYEKTTDNEIMMLVHYAENQQKEIEEKTTIILAGAEKVKVLEKEIAQLKYKKKLQTSRGNVYTKTKNKR